MLETRVRSSGWQTPDLFVIVGFIFFTVIMSYALSGLLLIECQIVFVHDLNSYIPAPVGLESR